MVRLLDSLDNVVVWEADDAFRAHWFSAGAEALLGVERSVLLAESERWANRILPRHRRRYQRAIDLARRTAQVSPVDYRATLPQGTIWLRDQITFYPDTSSFAVLTSRIEEARDTEERLGFLNKASTAMASSLDARRLIDRLGDLIVGSIADICLIEVLVGDERLFAVRTDRNLGAALQRMGPIFLNNNALPKRLREGRPLFHPKLTEPNLRRLVGNERAALIRRRRPPHAAIVAPLVVRGRVLGVVTLLCADPAKSYTVGDVNVVTDVCRQAATALDHARLLDEAYRSQESLRVEAEMKDEFLGIMSHELKTPLTVVYGVSRVLPDAVEALDEDATALLTDLQNASERTVQLIDDLMILARLNLGEIPELESVVAGDAVREAAAEFRREYPERALTADEDCKDAAIAAPALLTQVILNLLSNSHKYSPEGTPLRVAVAVEDDSIVFSVEDSGPGVPEEEMESIFDRFYRSSNSQGVTGYGLGLTICRRLALAQNGWIWAQNLPEGGLRISLALPRSSGASTIRSEPNDLSQ